MTTLQIQAAWVRDVVEEDVESVPSAGADADKGKRKRYIPLGKSPARCAAIKASTRQLADDLTTSYQRRAAQAARRGKQGERAVVGFPCLKLVTYPSGARSYVYRFDDPATGNRDSMVLGNADKVGLPEVVVDYQRCRSMVSNGINPRLAVLTVKQFWVQRYYEWAKATKVHPKNDKGRFDNHIAAAIGEKALVHVTSHDLQLLVDGLDGKRKPATVRHVAMLIKGIFRKARDWGFINSEPAKSLSWRRVQNERVRIATPDELVALFEAAKAENDPFVDCLIRFLLATGIRLSEALGSRWADVDRSKRNLMLTKTKGGSARPVPLSTAALAICDELAALRINEFLFPRQDGSGPMARPGYAWKRITERAGIQGLWLHDLRRTAASFASNEGDVDIYVISKLLGHASVLTTQRYTRVADRRVRHATEKVGEIIFGVAKKRGAE